MNGISLEVTFSRIIVSDRCVFGVDEEELMILCEKGVPEYAPPKIECIDNLPLISMGKDDYKVLEER